MPYQASITTIASYKDLLIPVLSRGERVAELPDLKAIRRHREEDISRLHESIRRLLNPHSYPAGLEASFHQFKTDLVLAIREKGEAALKERLAQQRQSG